ncbi:hypothetical protein BK128_10675 [Viridibacillus sp. FSL H7-0596]|uniref:DUF3021 domain-containing protein n=1 Tax=Viridibacillus sp. FSL H7-0596 TaxID=1928923 RepID=UPI00096E4C82|nr:DUF3021 domain-containing protein [Viridibacillus sp. FSL H7-0596]OMC86520.1 hypothetical protein BK128_10675 [Viridibacillus sp. FSL H7-0596]
MNIFKSLGFGISTGCTVFVTVNLIGYWIKGDLFLDAVLASFPQQVLGSIIVGIACILPSYIYRIERLTFLQQSACHFFISIGTFIVVAFSLKWIPTFSIKLTILLLLFNVLIFALVWLLFYFYSQSEVKKMKKKIIVHTDSSNNQ